MTFIREARPSEVDLITDLYLDMCRSYAERDPDSGIPEPGRIRNWIHRTTQTDDAVCLALELDRGIEGFILASVNRHPAMPGVVGELEELYVRPRPDHDSLLKEVAAAGIGWARDQQAKVIVATVDLDSPTTSDELDFWQNLGFENNIAELRLYDEGRC